MELAYRVGSALVSVLIATLVALIYGSITGWKFGTFFIILETSVLLGVMLLSEQLSFSIFVTQGKQKSNRNKKVVDFSEIISKQIIKTCDIESWYDSEAQLDFGAIRLRIASQSVIRELLGRLVALFLLIVLSPMLLICGLLVGLTSRGPVLVRIRSVGMNGKVFNLLRFRTSFSEYEIGRRHGHNLTTVGRFLDKTYLADVPALLNVILGSMNLIGPRPYSVADYYAAKEELSKWDLRSLVKPGITGLAQVECRYSDDLRSKLFYDLRYMADLSFLQEIKILLKTAYVVITGRGYIE